MCVRCGMKGHTSDSTKCKMVVSNNQKITGQVKITVSDPDFPIIKNKKGLNFLFGKIK